MDRSRPRPVPLTAVLTVQQTAVLTVQQTAVLTSSAGLRCADPEHCAKARRPPFMTSPPSGIIEFFRRPEVVTDMLQIAKTVIAATLGWWLSVWVLDSQMPFLAPWAALLTVHATIHRTLARGAQTMVASVAGVALSFVVGHFLGVSLWTFGFAMLAGVVLARVPWIRDEGIAIATTAIFVLGSGFGSQQPFLDERLIELALGVGVGVAVNLLIVPPLRDEQAAIHIDGINRRIGEVLTNMSDEFSTSWDTDRAHVWFVETEAMSRDLDAAWQTVNLANESRQANPRPRLRSLRRAVLRSRDADAVEEELSPENILRRLDEGVSHLRHLTRTLEAATYDDSRWDDRFRTEWADIVRAAGTAIADPDIGVDSIHDRLDALSVGIADGDDLPKTAWPLYGALITSVRHIAVIVDDVATAREVRSTARRGG